MTYLTDLSHAGLACFLQLIVGGIEGFKQSSDDLFSGLWQVITGCQGIFTQRQNKTFRLLFSNENKITQ